MVKQVKKAGLKQKFRSSWTKSNHSHSQHNKKDSPEGMNVSATTSLYNHFEIMKKSTHCHGLGENVGLGVGEE